MIDDCLERGRNMHAGGASTMRDFDSTWITEPIDKTVLKAFIEKGGQIFQGNVAPVEELLAAQERPEEHGQLIMRVGGYSARFVALTREPQDEIIRRIRHGA